MRLSEKYPGVALITGASAGLGKAFAYHVAEAGMDLVLVARRQALLQDLAGELRQQFGVQAVPIALDLTAPDAVQTLQGHVTQAGLQVSMLINNAGFGTVGYFHEQDPLRQVQMVDLNCRAPVALTAAFVPEMIRRKNGAIIMLASTASYQATPYMAVYGATKVFNLHFGEALWAELRPFGIDVLSVSPGFTRTEFQEVAGLTEVPPKFLLAEPDEVVRTCFRKLGKKPSVVHGCANFAAAGGTRLAPRRIATRMAAILMRPRHSS